MAVLRKYRVYLSSTFRDLEAHRAEVIKFFNVLSDRFELRNMEMYAPDGQLAVEACLNDVAECDVYLLLIGRRCGWIPGENPTDPASIAGNDKISITNLEFNKAVETGQCTILVFLCDPNDTSLPQDPADALFGPKQKKLGDLRDQANQYKHHASFFTSPDNLTRQVSEAIILTKKEILSPQEKSKLLTVYHSYCYDRAVQTVEYRKKMIGPERFKVFVVYGGGCELGESFIYRLGYFNLSFELKKYCLDLIGLLDSTTSAPALRLNVLFLVYDMLLPGQAEKEPALSPARIVEVVRTVHRKPFALYVRLPDGYWDDGVQALKGLIAEFQAAVQADPTVQMIWFVLAEDVPEERLLDADTCVLASAPDAPVYVLPELRAFSKELIGTWVQEYLTAVPSAKRKILETYFPSLKLLPVSQRTCQTEDVEAELLDIFQKLDQADEALYKLL